MSLKTIQNNFGAKLNVESDFRKLMGNDNNKKIKWGIENQKLNILLKLVRPGGVF